ncbi:hypothetical protein [Vitreimonas flagellata]|uniref:hypothetical protein n=1 Tax=Vitreimonas flagellata TaxID=2560861 RepID=UPI0010754E67|nr:hypothetical protein [Vitreimonas flagellata]
MNYSVRYLDKSGRTTSSIFEPFDDDAEAIAFARGKLPTNAIVEVWNNDRLISRLYQNPISQAAPS